MLKTGLFLTVLSSKGSEMFQKFKIKNMFFCLALGTQSQDAHEWLKFAEQQMRGDRSRSEMKMTITTPNWKRTLEITSDVEGKKQALSTIKSPAKEKGIKTLRLENNMWNYFPKLRRKIAVSSSMLLASWMGSDFTNDDILKASSMADDYEHRFDASKESKEYKVIINEAKPSSKVMWPKIITYSSKEDCLPRKYEYYDKENKLKRVLTFDNIKKFNHHLVPTHWEMIPQDGESKKTVIDYIDINFNIKFSKDHFTQKNLTSF